MQTGQGFKSIKYSNIPFCSSPTLIPPELSESGWFESKAVAKRLFYNGQSFTCGQCLNLWVNFQYNQVM